MLLGMSRPASADPMTTERVLGHLREVMFRATPLSEEEREAFTTFSLQLRRQLDAAEDALERAGAPTTSVQALRYLLEAVPGFSV